MKLLLLYFRKANMSQNPEIIYPTNIKKYKGSCNFHKKSKKWVIQIDHPKLKFGKSFSTFEEGFEHIVHLNIKHNLPIKNIIYNHGEYLEVELTQGKTTKVSQEEIKLINEHSWCYKLGYASTSVKGKTTKLHNLIKDYTVKDRYESVDHKNKDKLDNRRENLRVATQQEQTINQNREKQNKTGIIGVCYVVGQKYGASWKATWRDENKNQKSSSFSVKKWGDEESKQMAIECRKEMEKTLPHYRME